MFIVCVRPWLHVKQNMCKNVLEPSTSRGYGGCKMAWKCFIISAKWTKWMAEIMCSFDVFVSVFLCVRSGRSWELNANSSKTVKATDFKFDVRVPRDSLDMTSTNFPKTWRL